MLADQTGSITHHSSSLSFSLSGHTFLYLYILQCSASYINLRPAPDAKPVARGFAYLRIFFATVVFIAAPWGVVNTFVSGFHSLRQVLYGAIIAVVAFPVINTARHHGHGVQHMSKAFSWLSLFACGTAMATGLAPPPPLLPSRASFHRDPCKVLDFVQSLGSAGAALGDCLLLCP